MANFLMSKLGSHGATERVLRERLSEPLHLNLLSLPVSVLGSYSQKVYFDLEFRQYTAFCLLDAAHRAASLGIKRISALEFGVASGGGLLNICEHAEKVARATGVEFDVYGFDTGAGLPPPRSFRDHPELYQSGDYIMDVAALRAKLPPRASLVLGDIAETVPHFIAQTPGLAPIAYVAVDVDYYWSAVDALRIFEGDPKYYMPIVNMYLDDCQDPHHNPACGELLACEEFNENHEYRKIYPYTALRERRLFKNASWISKVFTLHVLDHNIRTHGVNRTESKQLYNAYVDGAARRKSA